MVLTPIKAEWFPWVQEWTKARNESRRNEEATGSKKGKLIYKKMQGAH
jgi:hypothetical protein